MRITLSLPDPIAQRFLATVPSRQRSKTVASLLEKELISREEALIAACHAANDDRTLQKEIDEWQAFDDSIPS